MIAQFYYTSTEHRLDGGKGFGPRARSAGLAAPDMDEIARIVTYDWGAMDTSGAPADFPQSISYGPLSSGRAHISNSVYLGTDFTGRTGNFFVHSLVLDDLDALAAVHHTPILLYGLNVQVAGSCVWCRSEEGLPPKADLPDLPQLPVDTRITTEIVTKFASSRAATIAEMVQAVITYGAHSRRLVILDTVRTLPLWVAAVTMALPRRVRKATSFETFRGDPGGSPAQIVGTTEHVSMPIDDRAMRMSYAVFDLPGGRKSEGFAPGPYARLAVSAVAQGRWGFMETVDATWDLLAGDAPSDQWERDPQLTERLDDVASLAGYLTPGVDPRSLPDDVRTRAIEALRIAPITAAGLSETILTRLLEVLQLWVRGPSAETRGAEIQAVLEVLRLGTQQQPAGRDRYAAAAQAVVEALLFEPEETEDALRLLQSLPQQAQEGIGRHLATATDHFVSYLDRAGDAPPGDVLAPLLDLCLGGKSLTTPDGERIAMAAARWIGRAKKARAAETLSERLEKELSGKEPAAVALCRRVIAEWERALPEQAARLLLALWHRCSGVPEAVAELQTGPRLVAQLAGQQRPFLEVAMQLVAPAFVDDGAAATDYLQALLMDDAGQDDSGTHILADAFATRAGGLPAPDAERIRIRLVELLPEDGAAPGELEWVQLLWQTDLLRECRRAGEEGDERARGKPGRQDKRSGADGRSARPAERLIAWHDRIFAPAGRAQVLTNWLRQDDGHGGRNAAGALVGTNAEGIRLLTDHTALYRAMWQELAARFFLDQPLKPLKRDGEDRRWLEEWLDAVGPEEAGDPRVGHGWMIRLLSWVDDATQDEPKPAFDAIKALSEHFAQAADTEYERALAEVVGAIASSGLAPKCALHFKNAYDGRRAEVYTRALVGVAVGYDPDDPDPDGRRPAIRGGVFGACYSAEPNLAYGEHWDSPAWDRAFAQHVPRLSSAALREANTIVRPRTAGRPELLERWEQLAYVESLGEQVRRVFRAVFLWPIPGLEWPVGPVVVGVAVLVLVWRYFDRVSRFIIANWVLVIGVLMVLVVCGGLWTWLRMRNSGGPPDRGY